MTAEIEKLIARLEKRAQDERAIQANNEAVATAAEEVRAILAALEPAEAGGVPAWLSNCVVCGRIVDTREKDEGGDGHGCEYKEGWTCSSECAEKLHPDPDWMKDALAAEAGGVEAKHMIRTWKEGDCFIALDIGQDIIAQGATMLEAWERLADNIAVEIYGAAVTWKDAPTPFPDAVEALVKAVERFLLVAHVEDFSVYYEALTELDDAFAILSNVKETK